MLRITLFSESSTTVLEIAGELAEEGAELRRPSPYIQLLLNRERERSNNKQSEHLEKK